MRDVYSRSCSKIGLVLLSWFLVLPSLQALAQLHYDATLDSLNRHPQGAQREKRLEAKLKLQAKQLGYELVPIEPKDA